MGQKFELVLKNVCSPLQVYYTDFFFGKRRKKTLLPKKKILYNSPPSKTNSGWFSRIFLHVFTFLKLVIRFGKKSFVKMDFFPKIPNFCRIELPLAKIYWMIVSPQKRVKKNPFNLYLPNTPIDYLTYSLDWGGSAHRDRALAS